MDDKQFDLIEKFINKTLTKFQKEQFQNFEQLFKIYNSHTNLMSNNDANVLFEKHIYDSLAFCLFVSEYNMSEDIKLLDVGTGGGFPSIPLGIIYSDMQIYPLDSIAKKIGFIEFVQKELRLKNLIPVCKRVENLKHSDKGAFEVVTSRAVASLNTLLEYTIPFVKKDGFFVSYKSRNAKEELEKAKSAMNVLNCDFIQSISYELPMAEDYIRELLIFKKTGFTPDEYPRKSGQAKKNPL